MWTTASSVEQVVNALWRCVAKWIEVHLSIQRRYSRSYRCTINPPNSQNHRMAIRDPHMTPCDVFRVTYRHQRMYLSAAKPFTRNCMSYGFSHRSQSLWSSLSSQYKSTYLSWCQLYCHRINE
ncbi:hypothetical protein TNCV_103221 [Trichonephila clavipes]|nr:hypothetical protein TNCV_103221 [Trichonephila clavipes]